MDSLPASSSIHRFGGVRFDPIGLDQAVALIAGRAAGAPFDYVSTPNAEMIYWAHRQADFMALLDDAFISCNDSSVLGGAARLRGKALSFAPGSYIVRDLFGNGLVDAHDVLTVIGGTPDVVTLLMERYGLLHVYQHVPPMGFIHDPAAVEAAIVFVNAHPARFVFIAMGPPHSDQLAAMIKQRGGATGLGLAIGSSLTTLLRLNARTPDWMERNGLVWLYRLLQEPRRLWRRYLGRSLRGLVLAVWQG